MTIKHTWLEHENRRRTIRVIDDGRGAIADGECPHCEAYPFSVGGHGQHIHSHDTYAADASCIACGERVGVMYARVDTLFGLEEDEAIANGRARVY